jgi:hypothetical protein
MSSPLFATIAAGLSRGTLRADLVRELERSGFGYPVLEITYS